MANVKTKSKINVQCSMFFCPSSKIWWHWRLDFCGACFPTLPTKQPSFLAPSAVLALFYLFDTHHQHFSLKTNPSDK